MVLNDFEMLLFTMTVRMVIFEAFYELIVEES